MYFGQEQSKIRQEQSKIRQKQVQLFEISLVNSSKGLNIKPLYTGFQHLKQLCEKIFVNTTELYTKKQSQRIQLHQIVWIDFRTKSQNNSVNQKTNQLTQQLNRNLRLQFEQILRNNRNKEFSLQKQIRFDQKLELTNSDKIPNLFLSAKPLIGQYIAAEDQQNDFQRKKITKNLLFLQFQLNLGSQQTQPLIQSLLSLYMYIGQNIILNCASLKENDAGYLKRLIGFVNRKVSNDKNYTKTTNIHLIHNDSEGLSINTPSYAHIYKIKNPQQKNNCKVILSSVKAKVFQKINKNEIYLAGNSNQNGLDNSLSTFLIKLNVISKIVVKSDYKLLSNNTLDLFQSENIKRSFQQLQKQSKFELMRQTKQKLQRFFQSTTQKNRLPLPLSILKFKIQSFMKENFNNWQKQEKLVKLQHQFFTKLQQKNQFQIVKTLQKSTSEYINKQLLQQSAQKHLKLFHPQELQASLKQYWSIVQSTNIAASQDHFNKYAMRTIYKQMYGKVYKQFSRLKTQYSGLASKQKEQIVELKERIGQLEGQANQNRNHSIIKDAVLAQKTQQIAQKREEIASLRRQFILFEQKVEIQRQQIQEQSTHLRRLQQSKSQSAYELSKLNQTYKQTNPQLDKMKKNQNQVSYFEGSLQRQLQKSDSLTKSFQHHLNSYARQYMKQKQQLNSKEAVLSQKELHYEEKIKLLQDLLKRYKQTQLNDRELTSNRNSDQSKKIEDIQIKYEEHVKSIQKDYHTNVKRHQDHISKLEDISLQKNKTIQKLNQQLWIVNKRLLQKDEALNFLQNKLKNHQKKVVDIVKRIDQKDTIISQKSTDNESLADKLRCTVLKIQFLELQIQRLKDALKNKSGQNQNNSFLKFQRDLKNQQNPKNLQLLNSRSLARNQNTPGSRSRVLDSQSKNSQDRQLVRLLQERKTIQKKKEKCDQRQSILQKMQMKLCSQTQAKFTKRNSVTKSSSQIMRTQSRGILRQSNRIEDKTTPSGRIVYGDCSYEECKKKLF